jgi:hypothetical protein
VEKYTERIKKLVLKSKIMIECEQIQMEYFFKIILARVSTLMLTGAGKVLNL